MLERYFKSEQEFNDYLDKTYDPDAFEQSFERFLNSLMSSIYLFDIKVNNFKSNESIADSSATTYKILDNSKTIFRHEDSFSFC